ncbi:hypothetical protein DL769_008194 [Monosporascus sp. CRB-8-3]|nr:hypothetical protein DL769_008194 [Monosporascus sp. CRB-8-3]
MVLLHPAKPSQATRADDSWTSKGDREEILKFYSHWSPAIRKWLEHADRETLEWTLYVHPEIPRRAQGRVALISDACHPMLPCIAQGAANAMEDAAVLAAALTCTPGVQLALIENRDELAEKAGKLTKDISYPRAMRAVAATMEALLRIYNGIYGLLSSLLRLKPQ